MKISVIVPFREADEITNRCIDSIKNQITLPHEIITVSEREFSSEGVKNITISPCGPGVKRNMGAKHATGDILFFVDSDALLFEDAVFHIEKLMVFLGDMAVMSGAIVAPKDGGILNFIIQAEYEYRLSQMGNGEVNVFATTCVAIRKRAFESVDGFREISTKTAIGEDWDMSARMKEKGHKFWHNDMIKVRHYSSPKLLKYFKEQYLHSRYRVFHSRKYPKQKDEYTPKARVIQPLLWLGIPFVAIFVFPLLWFYLFLMFACNIYSIARITDKYGVKMLLLFPISFIRSFFWLIGAMTGYVGGWK